MLTLPAKFLRESKKPKNSPFGLVTIFGRGESVIKTTEADWAGNTGEDNVDYSSSSPPPDSGNVILAPDSSSAAEAEGPDMFVLDSTKNDWDDPGKWLYQDCDDWYNDSDYIQGGQYGYGQADGHCRGHIDQTTMFAAIDENTSIVAVRVYFRARYYNKNPEDVNCEILYNGSLYYGTEHGTSGADDLTSSFATYYDEWASAPDGSGAWDRNKLALLTEAGMFCDASGSSTLVDPRNVRVSAFKIVVVTGAYTTDGFIKTTYDLSAATPNADDLMMVNISQQTPVGSAIQHNLYRASSSLSYMRPTNHHDLNSLTVNEANAYNGDDSDSATSTGSPVFTITTLCYFGRDSSNNDAWETEPSFVSATLKVTWSRTINGAGNDNLGIEVIDSTDSHIGWIAVEANTNQSKITSEIDVSNYIGDLSDLRVRGTLDISFGADGSLIDIFDIWIEGTIWETDAQIIKDGDIPSMEGGTKFLVESFLLSTTGAVTPILGSIELEVPKYIYRYSGRPLDFAQFNNVIPALIDIPGRTIEIDLVKYITKPSKLNIQLSLREQVKRMLVDNYLKNLEVRIDVGYYFANVTPRDMVPYFRGKINDYFVESDMVTIEISDAGNWLENKWPIGTEASSGPASKPSEEFADQHMVDIIQDIIVDVGTSPRFIGEQSFTLAKSLCGSDPTIPLTAADWVSNRTVIDGNEVTETKTAAAYIGQLLFLLGAYTVTPEDGRIRLKIYSSSAPESDVWGPRVYEDFKYEAGLTNLRNAFDLYLDWDGDGEDSADFTSLFITENQDSKDNYEETKRVIQKSEWLYGGASAENFGEEMAQYITARESARLANGLGMFSCSTSMGKAGLQVGDYITIQCDAILSPLVGNKGESFFIIVKKTWNIKANKMNWFLMEAR